MFGFQGEAVAGFMSFYTFHLNSEDFKTRVSQLLVLSPYRKHRLGYQLVRHLYDANLPLSHCVGITVEDPNDAFVSLQFRVLKDLFGDEVRRRYGDFAELGRVDLKAFNQHKTALAAAMKSSKSNAELLLLKGRLLNCLETAKFLEIL